MKYHTLRFQVEPQMGYSSRGRPTADDEKVIKNYKLKLTISRDEEKISSALNTKGRFILATNILDESKLSDDEILSEYKEQQQPERGFRFIKNSEFLVKSVFLKTPSRIQVLLMIMTLTLYIYNLGQYLLRESLKENDEFLPDQKKQPTQRPTLRWVFELMQGIAMITITDIAQKRKRFFAQITELQQKIIQLFGDSALKMYELNQENGTLGV